MRNRKPGLRRELGIQSVLFLKFFKYIVKIRSMTQTM